MMQLIEVDKNAGIELIKLLDLKPECESCGETITEVNFGGIFSKPTRVVCNNILCLVRVDDP